MGVWLLQSLLFPLSYFLAFLSSCCFPFSSQLLPIPPEHLALKCSFFTYTLCMAMHNLTISSQGLSLFPMDAIFVPVFTQLFPIPELAQPGPCAVYPPYINQCTLCTLPLTLTYSILSRIYQVLVPCCWISLSPILLLSGCSSETSEPPVFILTLEFLKDNPQDELSSN